MPLPAAAPQRLGILLHLAALSATSVAGGSNGNFARQSALLAIVAASIGESVQHRPGYPAQSVPHLRQLAT